MSKKSDGYKLGGIGSIVTIILAIISYNIGLDLSGQILWGITTVIAIFTALTFLYPKTFAPALQGIFEYLASLGDDRKAGGNTQYQSRTKNSHQVSGSGNKIITNNNFYGNSKKNKRKK